MEFSLDILKRRIDAIGDRMIRIGGDIKELVINEPASEEEIKVRIIPDSESAIEFRKILNLQL